MNSSHNPSVVTAELRPMAVIPANAEALFNSESWSIHVALTQEAKMDSSLLKAEHVHVLSPRACVRWNNGKEEYVSLQVIGRLLLIAKPIWS